MIDTGVFKYSTVGYRQFMAYIRDIKYTTINIPKAGVIYIQVGISFISYIECVLIQTLIGHIVFYIIKETIFFHFALQVWIAYMFISTILTIC